ILLSVILFQVNTPGIRLDPLEGEAERPIHMDAVALRLAAQGMEIKARDVQLRWGCGGAERAQPPPQPLHQVRWHTALVIAAPKPCQSLVPEAPYHDERVHNTFTCVNSGLPFLPHRPQSTNPRTVRRGRGSVTPLNTRTPMPAPWASGVIMRGGMG